MLCRNFRWYREPGKDPGQNMSAMLMQIGTVEETQDQCWYWILGCPIDIVREAGVDFDPSSKGIKPVQQQDSTQSALQVRLLTHCPFAINITVPGWAC